MKGWRRGKSGILVSRENNNDGFGKVEMR